jgi:hypothetical protein
MMAVNRMYRYHSKTDNKALLYLRFIRLETTSTSYSITLDNITESCIVIQDRNDYDFEIKIPKSSLY